MRLLIIAILFLCLSGCGDSATKVGNVAYDASESMGWDSNSSVAPAVEMAKSPLDIVGENMSKSETESLASGKSIKLPQERKIIYTASMNVVVEVFDGVEKKIEALVKQHGGFVSSANLGRMQGEHRSGTWTVRVPVDQYDLFLNAVGNIGVPASRNQTASDVTEEFVDLEARISNKKKLETRIVELLDRPDDKIQHVIEVERELARVREEIERMEGRLRYLQNQTSLTTVTIHVREERDYVPPQAPTLSSRIGLAWSTSLINGRRFLENAIVVVVANAIGFGVFLLGLLIAIPILRRVIRRLKNRSTESPAAETSAQS